MVTIFTRYAKQIMKPVTHVLRLSALPVHTEHRVPLEARKIQNVQRAAQGPHALPVTGSVCVTTLKQPTSAPNVASDQPTVMCLANGGTHATLLVMMITVAVMIVRTLSA